MKKIKQVVFKKASERECEPATTPTQCKGNTAQSCQGQPGLGVATSFPAKWVSIERNCPG